jgi:hypothetical protein
MSFYCLLELSLTLLKLVELEPDALLVEHRLMPFLLWTSLERVDTPCSAKARGPLRDRNHHCHTPSHGRLTTGPMLE